MRSVVWIFAVGIVLFTAAASAAPKLDGAGTEAGSLQLDRLVKDVCGKQVVLLGEDANHGAGRTLELKVELVERLIQECGFSGVFFESQVYDFVDLQRAIDSKNATPEQLADAIGGL